MKRLETKSSNDANDAIKRSDPARPSDWWHHKLRIKEAMLLLGMTMQVRNKVVEAYKEMMAMQI